jgi:hypothetical protein
MDFSLLVMGFTAGRAATYRVRSGFMEERSSGKEQRMNFEDFVADTDNTVVLKASEPDLQGTIRFRISSTILVDHLGAGNPVHSDENVKSCEAQREKIEAACLSAFKRAQSAHVILTAADFEPPQPPSDVDKPGA